MKKWKIKSLEFDFYTVLLLGLTVTAFVLRVYNVGYLTLWVDEYVHVDRARYFPDTSLFTDDNNGILLTFILIPLFKLFGASEFAARFPSVIFGSGLVPLIYFFVKKYFNRNAALISAALVTFSTYLAFWSRLSRNYAIFVFFFIFFLYYLGTAINVNDSFKERKNRFWNYLKIQPEYLWIALGMLFLSVISHLLTYLAIYGILFYYFVLFVDSLFHKKFKFLSFEAVVSYLFVFFSVVVFVSPVQKFFLQILPVQITNWGGLPDLARLSELMKTEPYKVFQIYFGILKYDYNSLYGLGFAGFIYAMVRYRKQGYFITSVFTVVFLVMSFVFREPALPRYLIYIYPLFLIAIALFFDMLLFLLQKIKIKPEYAVPVLVLIICFLPTAKASVKMVRSKEHGIVTNEHFSSFYFPDWKTSLTRIKPYLGENDVLMGTIPAYVNYYLGRMPYHFRQRMYDTGARQYVNLPVDTVEPNAASTPAVAKLLDNADKAWLVVDYYFNNVMTDPETKSYVVNRMKFEYDMSNQYVSVFSYDKTKPNTQPSTMFEFIHSENIVSLEYQFEKPATGNVVLLLDTEGIRYDDEMLVQFNGSYSVGILRSQGVLFRENGDSKSRQIYIAPVPPDLIKPGINTFKIGLNGNAMYRKCRFAVYNMQIQAAD
ncbi:MAG: glycosyltransferase family 39 protein [Dysgonamonadaceae bacterium]|jgi:hypothetical protein|nr:glycosyltransferase family 39 protein [Dysgonamonadaceae bacterium]